VCQGRLLIDFFFLSLFSLDQVLFLDNLSILLIVVPKPYLIFDFRFTSFVSPLFVTETFYPLLLLVVYSSPLFSFPFSEQRLNPFRRAPPFLCFSPLTKSGQIHVSLSSLPLFSNAPLGSSGFRCLQGLCTLSPLKEAFCVFPIFSDVTCQDDTCGIVFVTPFFPYV